ncbi:cellulose biosynthesis protein BcsS [Thioalkalivibrio sp. AKL17]|uniref:cellulose biosynthesis protein BcsS n=1 Tax=Thioalkalivibrio sp. AKL17 TaxID=1158160 RepID=UPI00036EBE6E|nr:cellulose biosynthesis protein BcsS [Thioalkalivibrio sp. AKL17]
MSATRRHHRRLGLIRAAALSVPLLALAVPVHADWLGLAGVEGLFDGGYAYTTAIIPNDGELGHGWAQRYRVDYSQYEYPDNDTTVKGRATGASAALGYQFPVQDGWLSTYVGAAWYHTRLDPEPDDSDVVGGRLRAVLDMDAGRIIDERWILTGGVSVTPADRAYWSRGRAMRRLGDSRYYLGPEVLFHGDRDYDAVHRGLALQMREVRPGLDMVVKTGHKQIRDGGDSGGYLGLELVRHFR